MPPREFFACVLANIVFLVGIADAGPHIVMPGEPQGDEIRAAAKEFLLKIADGDVDGAKSLFAGPPEQIEALNGQFRLLASYAKLQKAVIARFGESEFAKQLSFPNDLRARVERLPGKFIMLNGDDACISDGGLFDHGLDLHRFSNHWTVTRLAIRHAHTPILLRYQTLMADAADDARALVESGKLASTNDVGLSMKPKMMEAAELWVAFDLPPAEHPTTGPAIIVDEASVPTVSDIKAHFGQKLLSPEMANLIATLPGTPRISGVRDMIYVISEEGGLTLTFKFPSSALTTANFCGDGHRGSSPYPGKLPEGLKFWQPRRSVEEKFGPPDESNGSMTLRYSADYPSRGLFLSYAWAAPRDADNPLVNVTLNYVGAKSSTLPATRPAPTKPRVAFRLVVGNDGQSKSGVDRLPNPFGTDRDATLLVDREVLLDESAIAEERGTYTGPQHTEPGVSLTLTDAGTAAMEKITGANQGRQLAIVVDGEVICAPVIRTKISRNLVIYAGEDRSLAGRLHAVIFAISITARREMR